MVDTQENFDVTQTSEVFHSGVNGFLKKNTAMVGYLNKKVARLDEDINMLQSFDIKAGYMPDDDVDVRTGLAEIVEEVKKNLEALGSSIDAMNISTGAILDAAMFMRLQKQERAALLTKKEDEPPK
jgi:hypothetical protein